MKKQNQCTNIELLFGFVFILLSFSSPAYACFNLPKEKRYIPCLLVKRMLLLCNFLLRPGK
jgi:hypothetical protein